MTTKPEIRVEVSGVSGVGKSAIMQVLAMALNAYHIPYTVDKGYEPQPPRPPEMLTAALKSIASVGTTVHMVELQSPIYTKSEPDSLNDFPLGKRLGEALQEVWTRGRDIIEEVTDNKPKIKVGQVWYARLKGASACITCLIVDLSVATVEISSVDGLRRTRYPLEDVQFIEQLSNQSSKD